MRWPLQPLQPLQKAQLQPPFGPSVDLLCHPCITTTHLSYSVLSLKLPPPPCAVLLVWDLIMVFSHSTVVFVAIDGYYWHKFWFSMSSCGPCITIVVSQTDGSTLSMKSNSKWAYSQFSPHYTVLIGWSPPFSSQMLGLQMINSDAMTKMVPFQWSALWCISIWGLQYPMSIVMLCFLGFIHHVISNRRCGLANKSELQWANYRLSYHRHSNGNTTSP